MPSPHRPEDEENKSLDWVGVDNLSIWSDVKEIKRSWRKRLAVMNLLNVSNTGDQVPFIGRQRILGWKQPFSPLRPCQEKTWALRVCGGNHTSGAPHFSWRSKQK